jgi:hypothetical protein
VNGWDGDEREFLVGRDAGAMASWAGTAVAHQFIDALATP